jgi:hypothetical protein
MGAALAARGGLSQNFEHCWLSKFFTARGSAW